MRWIKDTAVPPSRVRNSFAPDPGYVRSYVLHPYRLAKDLKTGLETDNVQSVLDGDIDDFIMARLASK